MDGKRAIVLVFPRANDTAHTSVGPCTAPARGNYRRKQTAMNDEQYLDHCLGLLKEFCRDLVQRVDHLPEDDPLRELTDAFGQLSEAPAELYGTGPALVHRLFTTYPELAPVFPRQLLWFLGGECLHLMPDEEIEQYQQLEEQRQQAAARGETLDLRQARAKLLNLQ